jgi:hypothetical protein
MGHRISDRSVRLTKIFHVNPPDNIAVVSMKMRFFALPEELRTRPILTTGDSQEMISL